jgi:hypothetical protein
MCRVLEVSTSGYYAWWQRAPPPRARADAALQAQIEQIHATSRGTYGRPRIHAELKALGVRVGGKRVARLMRRVGLVPTTHQSGDTNRTGHITKRGSGELRAMLCEAAHHGRRPPHPLNPYFARLCARRGHKMASVAVAHRLCRILFAMLRDGTEFSPQRLGLEEGPFTHATTRQYRLTPRRT